MAKVNGLRAMFTNAGIRSFVDQKREEFEDKVLKTLQFMGEDFVNKARSVRTYKDQTGNLRSSIGYIILKDGKTIDQNFVRAAKGASGNKGVSAGKAFAEEVGARHPAGFVLIGVAGMEYAAYVEAKNYDVITGSAPTSKDFKEIFDAIKF